MLKIYSILIILFSISNIQCAEWFSATSELESLLMLEHKLYRPFSKLIQLEEKRLQELEYFVEDVENGLPDVTTKAQIINYVGSPYNSYKILSRFVHLWKKIDKYSSKNYTGETRDELLELLNKYESQMPAEEDVHGAIEALFRLQDTYKVKPSQLADGMGPKAHKLGVEELFELGFVASGMKDFYHAKTYLEEASKRFSSKASKIGFLDRESLLEYLGWAQYQVGETEEAISTTEEILRHNPDHTSATLNLAAYKEQLDENKKTPQKPKARRFNDSKDEFDTRCRAEFKPKNKNWKAFVCQYLGTHELSYFKPFKMERVCSRPNVVVIRNFLSLYELNVIKQLSKPKLGRATVHNPLDGKLMYADYRTSQSAWLREEEHPLVAEIIRRVGMMTGLDMRYSEPLQVVNYGVGGHYVPHFDHANEKFSKLFALGWGNRLATALFYLSDVEEGGHTAFTVSEEGCSVKPQRGDVVFWYNLKKNGKGDETTKHAACPVFIGNKWVANLWIHEYALETRHCSLSPDE